MSCTTTLRCLIPRFALYSWRSPAFTVPVFQNKHARNGCLKRFCSTAPKAKKETVTVYFIDRDGDQIGVQAEVGQSLLSVAIDNDIELEALVYTLMKNHTFDLQHSDEDFTSIAIKITSVNWKSVTVFFNDAEGKKMAAKARVGDSLLDVVVDNDLDIDGYGACEGTLACSTCHLIFKKEDYDKLPDEPCDEELDMLDLAYGLTDTSRLGCQISVTKDMEGLEVKVPTGVADAREPS